jgi:hypothetical protein
MCKNIAILNLPIEQYEGIEKLNYILNKLPFEFKINELDPSISLDNLNKLMLKSDLIIIPSHQIWNYYGTGLFDLILNYFELGGSIIYEVNPNLSDEQNYFLNMFDMKHTGVKLRSRLNYDIPFAMSDHSFKDRIIFKNIDQVILTQPNHIDYWGNAEPILRSNGNFLSIDGVSDELLDFKNKLITPIAINENINEGVFICFNGFIKIDNLNNSDDEENNKLFLSNIFNFILRKKSRNLLAYEEYRSIEKKLIAIIKKKLKINSNEDWLDKTPVNTIENIKINLKSGSSYEEGLNFIHLKKIIFHNWNDFKGIFDNNNIGKNNSLKWADYVNENRKDIAHPAKDLEDDAITFEVIKTFKGINSMLNELYDKI